MDVKSVILNGYILEKSMSGTPPGFEEKNFPNHIYKYVKLYIS